MTGWYSHFQLKLKQIAESCYQNKQQTLFSNILEVVAAGPECKSVAKGDMVYVHPETTGVIITIDEGSFVMVNEFMLLGVIKK